MRGIFEYNMKNYLEREKLKLQVNTYSYGISTFSCILGTA
jgi:hypothetical protein